MEKARKGPQQSILEQVASGEGIADIEAASDERKFRVYKLTLREIGEILKEEDIARASLAAIKTALNEVENGFIYLLNRRKMTKRDFNIVMPKLIDAKAHLTTALTELGRGGRGKRFEYSQALSNCKLLIGMINHQLGEPEPS